MARNYLNLRSHTCQSQPQPNPQTAPEARSRRSSPARIASFGRAVALAAALVVAAALGAGCSSTSQTTASPSSSNPSLSSPAQPNPASPTAGVPMATDSLPALPPPVQDVSTQPDTAAVSAALVGLPLTEAEAKAQAAGYTTRIASVDGEGRALTMDYSPSRINLDVVAEKVTNASVG